MRHKYFTEKNLIQFSSRIFSNKKKDVLMGIGDDAAVLKFGDKKLLITTDSLQEHIHFEWKNTSPFLLGRKSLAVNLSDIAAMGGKPLWAVISIAIPTPFLQRRGQGEVIQEFYRGLQSSAKEFGVSIVGGDTDHSKKDWKITITLLGEVKYPIYRSGAKRGDDLWVTGFLGAAPKNPIPRVREGILLSQKKLAHAMVDISDGFLLDLEHLCEASSCGAQVSASALPVDKKSLSFALSRGEDYELLFATSPKKRNEILKVFRSIKTKVSRVGKFVSKSKGVFVVDSHGQKMKFSRKGYQHF